MINDPYGAVYALIVVLATSITCIGLGVGMIRWVTAKDSSK
jgi:hypothetical protein